jgi:hypothetical protein
MPGQQAPPGVEKPSVLEPKVVAPLLKHQCTWHSSRREVAPRWHPRVIEGVLEAGEELVGDVTVHQVMEVAENSQPSIVGQLGKVIVKPLRFQECIGLPLGGHHLSAAHPRIVLVHSSAETLSLAP